MPKPTSAEEWAQKVWHRLHNGPEVQFNEADYADYERSKAQFIPLLAGMFHAYARQQVEELQAENDQLKGLWATESHRLLVRQGELEEAVRGLAKALTAALSLQATWDGRIHDDATRALTDPVVRGLMPPPAGGTPVP